MKEKSSLPQSLYERSSWTAEANPIWLATSITLHRNLANQNFPPKMEERGFQQTYSILKEQILKNPQLKQPALLNAEEISALDKEYLYEHFLGMDGFQNTLAGQGFVVDDTGLFFAKLNIEDHLQLQLIDTEGSWEKTWNQLNQIETELGKTLDYAFSPRFGFLTSDPTLCGTGLTTQAFLHLPALIHTKELQETLLKQKEEGITAIGMGGSSAEWIGDIVVLKNTYTLGISEEAILHTLNMMAMKLMAMEKTLRSHLQNENNEEIIDLISRSFGLLLHSYNLQAKEALEALSLLKLGLHLDWVDGIDDTKLNRLFFQARRAHLLQAINQPQLTDSHEIAHKRAEYLHQNMKGVFLKFES